MPTSWDTELKQRFEELRKDSSEATKIDRKRAEDFEALVAHPGWPTYQALLSSRIQLMSDMLTAPAGSLDGCIAQEYVKGAMCGLLLAQDFPSVIITATRKMYPQENEEEQIDDDHSGSAP